MRTRALIWAPLVLVLLGAETITARAATDGELAVLAAEQQWLKSQQTNNMDLLAPLLAERVVYTTEDRIVLGKSAVLAAFKGYIYSNAEYEDLKVTLFGHTAVATGIFIGTARSAAGKPRIVRLRFTDTWVRMTGHGWLCVATQD